MLIQCTATLQNKIEKYVAIEDLTELRSADENIGGETDFFAWHANLHPFDQKHSRYTDATKIPGFKEIRNTVILTHNVSHAPAVIIAARAATYKNFVEEVKRAVRTTLLTYGATENFVEQYVGEPLHFTRTGTRRQVGLHNEVAKTLQWMALDYVYECRNCLENLPRVIATHMMDFILGGDDYHQPVTRMQEYLKKLDALSLDIKT